MGPKSLRRTPVIRANRRTQAAAVRYRRRCRSICAISAETAAPHRQDDPPALRHSQRLSRAPSTPMYARRRQRHANRLWSTMIAIVCLAQAVKKFRARLLAVPMLHYSGGWQLTVLSPPPAWGAPASRCDTRIASTTPPRRRTELPSIFGFHVVGAEFGEPRPAFCFPVLASTGILIEEEA